MAVNAKLRQSHVGEEYGELTIVGITEERLDIYRFACACGTETLMSRSQVAKFKWSDCGCAGIHTGDVKDTYTVTGRQDLSTRPRRGKFDVECLCGYKRVVGAADWLKGIGPHRCWANSEMVGKTYGRLTVVMYSGTKDPRGSYLWDCTCTCGNVKTVSTVDLNRGTTRSCGCLQPEIAAARAKAGYPRVAVPRYAMAHRRIWDLKGKASEHTCVTCGGEAAEWAYDGQDPLEVIGTVTHKGLAYSLNPDHYQPMCKPCHGAFDAQMRRERKSDLALSV